MLSADLGVECLRRYGVGGALIGFPLGFVLGAGAATVVLALTAGVLLPGCDEEEE